MMNTDYHSFPRLRSLILAQKLCSDLLAASYNNIMYIVRRYEKQMRQEK